MAYEKQDFLDGLVLTAAHMNHIEDGIVELENAMENGDFDGSDGVSPSIEVSDITGGHRISITDLSGTKTVDVMNGTNGSPGKDGASPTVTVSPLDGGHRIAITDLSGTKTVDVMNGAVGKTGDPGRGIISVVRTAGTGAAGTVDTYTITYSDDTTSTFTVYNGANGKDGTGGTGGGGTGADGEDGATFIPYVDANGNLSWSNDKGLANPDTVNIKGIKGDTGSPGRDGVSATHSWNGTTLTVNSASGTSSANLKGDKGDDGSPGKDGVSVTHSWSGTKLSITSASGTSSVDLKGDTGSKGDKGDTGAAGYSPVRGTDYWTASDIAEIKSYVDNAILGGAW